MAGGYSGIGSVTISRETGSDVRTIVVLDGFRGEGRSVEIAHQGVHVIGRPTASIAA
jgi:hypothetical protein